MEDIRRALVLGLVLIAGIAIEHDPSVGLHLSDCLPRLPAVASQIS